VRQWEVRLVVQVVEADQLADVVQQLSTVAAGHAMAGRWSRIAVETYETEDATEGSL
jgi:hypothetical protein